MTGSLEGARDPELEQRARALYSAELPYHNFEHVLETLDSAAGIVARCRTEGIRIDARVVYLALLMHDAGYREDHRALGYESKEAYSAALADDLLAESGIAQGTIAKVRAAILATEKHGTFVSAEQKAVRAADLSGMAAPFAEFLRKSLALKREFEFLHGRALSWAEWQENSREVLEFYLSQEIRLTSYFHDDSGQSAFHRAVRSNLDHLLAEPAPAPPA